MNWSVGFILAFGIVLPVGIGLGLGAYRAAQSPKVMAEAAALMVRSVMPLLSELVLKRNTPEVEQRMRECYRRGGRWDNFKKRCVDHR